MLEYYVIKSENTGYYFRGKGANRWGKYFNQASVYRMKSHAENTAEWLCRHGEPSKIVPVQIVENAIDVVEVVRCKDCRYCHSDAYGLWCFNDYEHSLRPNDFCSYGERKT